ncbi:unnamed protein product [Symbiodinium sp. CCMP2456]|nr:unnamed protein product [Symbiodinium sp. CCMP2456]
MVAPAILAIFALGCTVVAAGRLAQQQQHSTGALQPVALSKSVLATAKSRALLKVTDKQDLPDEEVCQSQIASFDRHVKEFCEQIRPDIQNGSYAWLTYISDVRATEMATSISAALWAGQPDASSGFLFARASFREKGLLLWSGAGVHSRQFWCEELGLYMLHDDILGDAFRTPFGSLLEMEGVKDSKGRLFGSCGWERVAPFWRSASEAVVQRSSQELGVRVLLNKALVGGEQTLTKSAFFRFELVGLARHPPKQGMRILNAHESVKCRHVMPLIRARIEEVGSAVNWKSVQSFACVDIPELPESQARALDSQASQFPKPWSDLDPECKVTNQALTRPLFLECLSKGQVAWTDLSELNGAQRIKGVVSTLQERGPQVAVVFPDLVRMLPSRILEDFFNVTRKFYSWDHRVNELELVSKAWDFLSDGDWTVDPDLPTLRLLLTAPRDEIRLKAVQALAAISRQSSDIQSVMTCLWMAMSDDSREVRGTVAQTLVHLGTRSDIYLALETVKKVLSGDAESVWHGPKTNLILESGIADERAVATAVMVLEGLADQHFGAVLPILKRAAASGKIRTRLKIIKAAATLCKNDRTRKGDLLPLLQNAAADVAPAVSREGRDALIFSCPRL